MPDPVAGVSMPASTIQPDPTTIPVPGHAVPERRRRVIVKYRDDVAIPVDDTGLVRNLAIPGWNAWQGAFPGLENRRLFQKPAQVMTTLASKAEQLDPSYPLVNLRNYVAIYVPATVPPGAVAVLVQAHPAVTRAWVEPLPTEPPSVTTDDARLAEQDYVDPAEARGIDARCAWGFTGGDGAGQHLVDLERGWDLTHEDLVGQPASVVFGVEDANLKYHGTGVLGVIAADDNTVGYIGIATNVASIRCISALRAADVYSLSEALLEAVLIMSWGQVLLIEEQTDIYDVLPDGTLKPRYYFAPAEALDDVYHLVRLATALGIVVIQAAGNGSLNLDDYSDAKWGRIFNPNHPGEFRDSGATFVGATHSSTGCRMLPDSNHGLRIDCFAWGENVNTLTRTGTGYGIAIYRTSAAAAIVAGAALCVQGLANTGRGVFGAWQLRDILSDPAHGTVSDSGTDVIGVMPDLRKIIAWDILELAPDVYLRDHVGDDGDPHEGAISASPDVFVRRTQVADPNAAFGVGSGMENDPGLSEEVLAGNDHFVYVRALNRGGVDAAGVEATVYWANSASLLDPGGWTLVGKTTIANVSKGNVLTVSNPISWPAAQVPGSGHYCFVALLGHADDPAPAAAKFREWDYFNRFIRANNNVTWRNFDVVDTEAAMAAGGGFLSLPFDIVGAWDELRPMTVEIGGRLPRSASLRLELPREALRLFRVREGVGEFEPPPRGADPTGRRVQVPLGGWMEFREVPLPVGARIAARLLVHLPEALRRHEYEVFVRQLYHGDEVGRVTWRLASRSARRRRGPGR